MTETEATPSVQRPEPKRRRKIRVSDIFIFAVLAAVIIILAITLYNRVVLKRDVANAQVVSDKVIADIQKRDGPAARALGNAKFKSTYSDKQLSTQFKAIEMATLKPPKLDRTISFTGSHGRTVFFIYKYTALKVPFYIRTGVTHTGDQWYLTQISGSADESSLIIQ